MFFLGFIAGIVFCVLAAIVQFRYESQINREIQKVKNTTKEKGIIIEDQEEKAMKIQELLNSEEL